MAEIHVLLRCSNEKIGFQGFDRRAVWSDKARVPSPDVIANRFGQFGFFVKLARGGLLEALARLQSAAGCRPKGPVLLAKPKQ